MELNLFYRKPVKELIDDMYLNDIKVISDDSGNFKKLVLEFAPLEDPLKKSKNERMSF